MQQDYIVGLDLGQSRDYSALAVVERTWSPSSEDARERASRYDVRFLRRWPLGASYAKVAADVAALVQRPPLDGAALIVDQTGVGQGVVDFMTQKPLAASLQRVHITSGGRTSRSSLGVWRVPKKELIFGLQRLLKARRLQAADLPERAALLHELSSFAVRITAAGREAFAARRERDHDDLVLAVALAVWWGEKTSPLS